MTASCRSYRSDPGVPDFPDDKPLLFFDGTCVLCSSFAQYVIRSDPHKRIRLCTAQSALGQALYRHYGLDPTDFETNLLVAAGRPFCKSEAFIETMTILGGWRSAARLLRLCPLRLRDMVYDPIAANRYRLFGQRLGCYVPGPAEKDRFLS